MLTANQEDSVCPVDRRKLPLGNVHCDYYSTVSTVLSSDHAGREGFEGRARSGIRSWSEEKKKRVGRLLGQIGELPISPLSNVR